MATISDAVSSLRAPDAAVSAAEVDALLLQVGMPADLRRRVVDAGRLVAPHGPVAVRSSATAEDSVDASYAGQFGLIEVVATADGVEVRLEGRRSDGTVRVSHEFVSRSGG